MIFAHITDTHVNKPGHNPLFGMDAAAKLREVFAKLGQQAQKPSFVVITGDLTHDGDADDYRFLRVLLQEEGDKLGVPVHVALGNHDSRPGFREGYLGEAPSEQAYYYAVNEQGLRLIVLNTQLPGSHDGAVDEEQLGWLRAQLAEPAPLGTVIALHHPVVATPSEQMDRHLLLEPERLQAAIEGSDVIGLLAGHIHFNSVGLFAGVPCFAGTGSSFGIDPSSRGTMRFIDSSGYNLVLVKDGRLISHPIAMPGEQKILFEYEEERVHA
ncbi:MULTISPECIES: metallophosphoesterase [unclassified Paenibacillus]|uniref:metallophosphoesterase family protein n=1 Tax=unclassified Paenibacillus TaxID=185978 RepID=UPI000955E7DD|nr:MULTISPECIES: metallophosphoesterase [unclassified Paenibacillus]ASS66089.1 metallophosphatase [Paenibacillus sp. RUD330]SIQ12876.1 Calcineurin-like phosphoesterase [Paenibacillus sp. RU4X]SIQ34667.1 Calcineurin-like phosphoesterase [Paenibacillus sp. RU4T]